MPNCWVVIDSVSLSGLGEHAGDLEFLSPRLMRDGLGGNNTAVYMLLSRRVERDIRAELHSVVSRSINYLQHFLKAIIIHSI